MDLKVVGAKGHGAQRRPLILVQLRRIRHALKERLGHGEPEFVKNVLCDLFRARFLIHPLYPILPAIQWNMVLFNFLAYNAPMHLCTYARMCTIQRV